MIRKIHTFYVDFFFLRNGSKTKLLLFFMLFYWFRTRVFRFFFLIKNFIRHSGNFPNDKQFRWRWMSNLSKAYFEIVHMSPIAALNETLFLKRNNETLHVYKVDSLLADKSVVSFPFCKFIYNRFNFIMNLPIHMEYLIFLKIEWRKWVCLRYVKLILSTVKLKF